MNRNKAIASKRITWTTVEDPAIKKAREQREAREKATVLLRVVFRPCGAEFHPSFSSAFERADGNFVIFFPIEVKGILKSRKAQMGWAENKVKHLRSWGCQGYIEDGSRGV